MDVVSDVIASMRVGQAMFVQTRRDGEWGNRFGPYSGAGFHIVLRGSCWFLAPSGPAKLLTAGDVAFLPHGAMHGLSSAPDQVAGLLPPHQVPDGGEAIPDAAAEPGHYSGGVTLLCGMYQLDEGQAHPLLRALPEAIHIPAGPGSHPALRASVDLLGADLKDAGPGADVALPALLDLLLVYILRAWLEEETSRSQSAGWSAALADPPVAAALNHIHRHTAHPWTVQELARRVGMSRTAFARRFTRLVGQPPMAYLTWWRLSTAARILRAGDDSLGTVARRVGYTSEFAFANAFKRAFGVAPGRFRQARRTSRLSETD
jgi:AraC-like DNA-binding protein